MLVPTAVCRSNPRAKVNNGAYTTPAPIPVLSVPEDKPHTTGNTHHAGMSGNEPFDGFHHGAASRAESGIMTWFQESIAAPACSRGHRPSTNGASSLFIPSFTPIR